MESEWPWRWHIVTQAHDDAAFADIEQAVHSLDFSKIKPIRHMSYVLNSIVKAILYCIDIEFQILN